MKGASGGSTAPAFAVKTKAHTQTDSHANLGFQQFIGIFDGSDHPNRL
jgi:hypothetical protein